jgi:Flp pilus assembly protein TadD
MFSVEDLFSLTEDTPFFPVDQHDILIGRLVFRGAAIFLLTAIVYVPLLGTQFLWPDEQSFKHNAALVTYPGVEHAWSHPNLRAYSPLVETFLLFEHKIGQGALACQVVGILLQASNALLLWLLLRRLQIPGAWLAAAIFGIHPLMLQPVWWIGQQDRLWATFFSLGAILLFLRASGIPADASLDGGSVDPDLPPRRWKNPLTCIAASAMFVCGVLCLPAVGGIALILPWFIARQRRPQLADWFRSAPFLLIATAALVLLLADGRVWSLMRNEKTALGESIESIFRIVWPHPLISMRAFRVPDRIATFVKMGFFVLFVPLFLARRRLGSGPLMALCCVIVLAPTTLDEQETLSRLIPGGDSRLYIVCIPILVLLVACVVKAISLLHSRISVDIARLSVGLACVAVLGLMTVFGSRAYADTETLWQTAVAQNPDSLAARGRLALWYIEQGQPELAAQQLHGLDPAQCLDMDYLTAEGQLHEQRGEINRAIDWYTRAAQVQPADRENTSHLAVAYIEAGRLSDANAYLDRALGATPNDPNLHNDLGLLLGQRGNLEGATAEFRAAVRIDPNFVPARINLANALFAAGKLAEAADQLQETVKVDPQNFDAFHNAGLMLCMLHQYADAERMLRAAVRLKPESAQARNDLGADLVATNQLDLAIYQFRTALSLKSDYEAARTNLAIAQRRRAQQQNPTSQPSQN